MNTTFNLDPPFQRQKEIIHILQGMLTQARYIIHPPFWRVGDATPYFLFDTTPISRREFMVVPYQFTVTIFPTGEWSIHD